MATKKPTKKPTQKPAKKPVKKPTKKPVKKTAPNKKKKKRTPKKPPLKTELIKAIVGLIILLVLVVIAGLLLYYVVLRQPAVEKTLPEKPVPEKVLSQPEPHVEKPPPFEIYPEEKIPEQPVPKPVLPAKTLPKVAIIIDDIGYQRVLDPLFLNLDKGLTISILPFSPHQKEIARSAHKKGIEIMLHLPMEPVEYPSVRPGPGVLLTAMTPDQLIRQLEIDLDEVPYIRGVNNHMGSRMTANSNQMYQVFTVLKKRRLFFVDSRTSARSVGRPSARLFKVPFAQRDVFIDHLQDTNFIRKQLKVLVKTAKKDGQAIGIAHPHEMTYDILFETLPEIKKQVVLVPASQLVHVVQ